MEVLPESAVHLCHRSQSQAMDVNARGGGLQGQTANPDPQTNTRFYKKTKKTYLRHSPMAISTCSFFQMLQNNSMSNKIEIHSRSRQSFPLWPLLSATSMTTQSLGLWQRSLASSASSRPAGVCVPPPQPWTVGVQQRARLGLRKRVCIVSATNPFFSCCEKYWVIMRILILKCWLCFKLKLSLKKQTNFPLNKKQNHNHV